MEKIVLASNNEHKLKEFREILKQYNVLSLKDIGFTEDIDETGTTFEENSMIKVNAIVDYLKTKNLNYIVISDDSGLSVDSLNGAPGVKSARYAENHNDKANRDKLLKELAGKERKANFTCAISVCFKNGIRKSYVGKTYGEITTDELGKTDFGYDCIFYSSDLHKTFGEASEEEKNAVSHRGRAIQKMLKDF